MVISLCLFICNDKASLMQLLLSYVVASFSGSSELNCIFNQLGITVSYETIHRYITNVVDALIENHMKSYFVTDAFLVTSVDNVDKGTPLHHSHLGTQNMVCMAHQCKQYNQSHIQLKTIQQIM